MNHCRMTARSVAGPAGNRRSEQEYGTSKKTCFFFSIVHAAFNPRTISGWVTNANAGACGTEFFLRGGSRECFSLIVGDTEGLEKVKYIITLDTDTQLPVTRRGSSWGPWHTH